MSLTPAAALVAEIGVDGEVAAAAKLAAFGAKVDETAAKQVAGANKIGGAFKSLDGQLAGFGLPFTGALGKMGSQLQTSQSQASGFAATLGRIGTVEAAAAVVGIAAVGAESIHLASDEEAAHARLQVALTNTGASTDAWAGTISNADTKMEHLGFTSADSESSLALLDTATKNVNKSITDEALAADVARGRHIDLASATSLVVKVETGHVALLGRLGINVKDASGKIIDQTTALQRLAQLYGGDASAYASTFSGKQAVLGAQLKDMGASLGEVLIPKVEGLISTGSSGISMFQDLNHASGGFIGNVALVGAGLPIAVAGVTKLVSAGQSLGAMFYTTSAAAAASAGTQTAEAAAATEATTAHVALRAALLSTTASAEEVTAASEAAAAAETRLGQAAATTAGETGAAGMTALGGAGIGIAAVLTAATVRFSRANAEAQKFASTMRQATADLTTGGKAAQEAGQIIGSEFSPKVAQLAQAYQTAVIAGKQQTLSTHDLEMAIVSLDGPTATLGNRAHALAQALHDQTASMGSAQLQTTQLSAAQRVYGDLVASGSRDQNALKNAYNNVVTASRDAAATQNAVNAATSAGEGQTVANTAALSDEAKAYEGVALTASQAASAMSQMDAQAFAGLKLTVDQHKVSADLAGALGDLKNVNKDLAGTGGGGGGGSHKSVAVAALDQAQKELTLRDALKAVGDQGQNLVVSLHGLANAQTANRQAAADVTAAEKTYQQVIHGVAADTLAAQTAQEDLNKSQLSARSAALDTKDAEAQLTTDRKTAVADQVASAQQVKDAQAQLAADTTGGADPQTIIADTQAVAQAKTAAAAQAAADNEKVQRSEIALAEKRLAQKDAVTALNASSRTYHDTLHGFPVTSDEAKTAQQALTTAQQAATSAGDQLNAAVRGVRDVEDQAATNALTLKRDTMDLNGQLNAVGGAGGGVAKAATALQGFQTKLDAAALAAQAEAIQTKTVIEHATGSVAEGMLAEVGALQMVVAQQPLLASLLGPAIANVEGQLRHMATVAFINGAPVALDTSLGRAAANAAHRGGQNTAAHASGGTVMPGEITTLGEQGTELGYLRPDGSGMDILSAPQTRHALGGDNALLAKLDAIHTLLSRQRPINIQSYGPDAEDVARVLAHREQVQRMMLLSVG